jgi:flavin-dependent dehydrogenase
LTEFPRQVDVLVAGAGPAGSATSALLAQKGFSVLAADRASFPRDKACSEYMSPETVRILSRLGILNALEAAGGIGLEGLKVTAPDGGAAHGRFVHAVPAPYRPTGLAISRRILDHELVKAARIAGAIVAERTFVEELLYDRGAITGAVLRDSLGVRRSIRAKLTVGADGLRSVVARRIGHRKHGRPRRVAFVAHMGGVTDLGLSAELHFRAAGYVGVNPIAEGVANVALVVPVKRAAAARGRAQQFFLDGLAEFPQVSRRVEGATIVRPVMATGPFAAWSGRVVAPGALLVGDAADFFDPFTGDGIYSALRGAELIADIMPDALSRDAAEISEALRQYRRARRRVFAGKWIFERFIGWSMYLPKLFERGVGRIGRRDEMAGALIGVAGGFVPAREVFNPVFLARMIF